MTTRNATVSVLPPGAGGRVLDFRRRGTPPRRRRRSVLLALLSPMLAACGLVALPAGVVAWVLTAPRFQLQAVEVNGASRRISYGWVRQALAPLEGENLVRISLAEAATRVRRNPWIASVEMVKELPDRLRVRVAERRPVALLLAGASLVYADSEGRSIAPIATPADLQEARAAGLLVVSFAHPPHEGGIGAALEAAAELGRVQPTWAAKLARIEVLGEEDFRLQTDALPFPLLVRRGQVGPKVQRLVELLPELSRRYPRIAAVDLRFSRRIVVQPAPPAPPAGKAGAPIGVEFSRSHDASVGAALRGRPGRQGGHRGPMRRAGHNGPGRQGGHIGPPLQSESDFRRREARVVNL